MNAFSVIALLAKATGWPAWAAEAAVLGVLIVGSVGGFYTWLAVHDHHVAAAARDHEDKALKDQGERLARAAAAANDEKDRLYAANVKAIEAKHATETATGARTLADYQQRVRDAEAYRRTHPDPVPANTASTSGGADAGTSSPGRCEGVLLLTTGALDFDDGLLRKCRAERRALK